MVIKREDQSDFWLPIGAAFPHQSGDWFDVVLQTLPISYGAGRCKIVLRSRKDGGDSSAQDHNDHTNKSGSQRRLPLCH